LNKRKTQNAGYESGPLSLRSSGLASLHQTPITDHCSPFTDFRSPFTDHCSPITNH